MLPRTLSVVSLLALVGCSTPRATDPDVIGDHDAAADAPVADAVGNDTAACNATSASPSPRGDAVGGIDPATGALWVVGGDEGPTLNCRVSPSFTADVWRYEPECDRWTQVMAADGPTARARGAAAVDARRGRLVTFGGRFRAGGMGAYTLYDDVWAFDFAAMTWSRVTTSGAGPSARANTSAIYDAVADELVVFGGNTSRDGLRFVPQSDTWALNLETRAWRQVSTTGTAPSARLFHAAAVRGRTMLVAGGGGANAFTGPFYNDAFALDLASGVWTELALSGVDPLGRINLALVADPMTDRFLMVAGHDDGNLGNRNDVLAIAPSGAVSALTAGDRFDQGGSGFCDFPPDFATVDLALPERRGAFVLGVDPTRNRALVFGGKTDCGSANDVWSVDLATGAWRPLRQTSQGVACLRSGRTDCSAMCN